MAEARFSEFGSKSSYNIVASTSNGDEVMVKFSRFSNFNYQLCYNHGINLAIIDAFYNSSNVCNRKIFSSNKRTLKTNVLKIRLKC